MAYWMKRCLYTLRTSIHKGFLNILNRLRDWRLRPFFENTWFKKQGPINKPQGRCFFPKGSGLPLRSTWPYLHLEALATCLTLAATVVPRLLEFLPPWHGLWRSVAHMMALDTSFLQIMKFLVPNITWDTANIARFHASATYMKTFLHYTERFAVKKKI